MRRLERKLIKWAENNRLRDELVREAFLSGITKKRISDLMGIARTTIDRVLDEFPS